MSFAADLTFDELQKGWYTTSELNYQWDSSWIAYLQWDHLALLEGSEPELEGRFIDLYKANDQLSLGVNYVF